MTDGAMEDKRMYGLTDLHTHILPGMDDGAQTAQQAKEMLLYQKKTGVQRVMLTPHFYPRHEELSSFLDRRERAYQTLMTVYDKDTMPEIRLGAEVRYSDELEYMDLHQLTLGGGRYLLLELSGSVMPARIKQVVDAFAVKGITPVLAHVERCAYFRGKPESLRELIHIGALAQVSARELYDMQDAGFAKACIKNNMAQMVASDAHDLESRRPCLASGMERLSPAVQESAERFARQVWDDAPVESFKFSTVKKGIFTYR